MILTFFVTHNFTPAPKLCNLTTCLFYVSNRKCVKFSSLFLARLSKIKDKIDTEQKKRKRLEASLAFKLYENALDGRSRELVDIGKIQYGFMPGRGTVDVVFVLRRLGEKFKIFVDLGKAFDRCEGKLFVLLEAEGCPRIFGKGVYVS